MTIIRIFLAAFPGSNLCQESSLFLQPMHLSYNCTNIPPHHTTLTLLQKTYQHQTTLHLNAVNFLSPHYIVNHKLYTLKPGTPQPPQLKPWEFTATCGVLVNLGHTQLHNMCTALCTVVCIAQHNKKKHFTQSTNYSCFSTLLTVRCLT